ncbi:unnamed protein product [Rotaria sp. Silwood2]|nr:unnamed protein product [Rotaria sp. Silwood2]CAF2830747.1 unnamed protein product [Rotaria sp. Silwood2]CAF3263441.1 unnamed protein product [Rotaria sp. Silwood2]CAF4150649.1 unnamed protein product [Rotaria sp. Silwood2]CAF4348620.1 unnamed protein product [Rotaria sp. Silwood2]
MGSNIKLSLFAFVTTIIATSYALTKRNIILQNHIDTLQDELQSTSLDAILFWNQVMLQACANDYDKAVAFKPDQNGPAATARAFAIIHGAMYDTMKNFGRVYQHVTEGSRSSTNDSFVKQYGMIASIIEAAYQTLSFFYPQQRPLFDAIYRIHLYQTRNKADSQDAINIGLSVGQLTSSFMIETRKSDGSFGNAAYTPSMQPGYHKVDPIHPEQGFLGVHWGKVKPFFLDSVSQYRPLNMFGNTSSTRMYYLNSDFYRSELTEVKTYGSKASTYRSDDQTQIGIVWAYDGAPKLGTPPRLYNQIVRIIAIQQGNTLEQNARLFALVNYAMGDAGIAAWEAKYHYAFWRPIVGIREAQNANDIDPTWIPLGAPADGAGTDFTPPFPAYVSGHATFGSATFHTLRLFYNRDDISFQFQSDEYNGKTKDSNTGLVRPALTRSYRSLAAAEMENAISRIYLGVHWRSDVERGKILGQSVALEVFRKLF